MFWANWWALVWLHVTVPVVLDVDSGDPASPGGVSYSESSDSDCISSHLWGGVMCIWKFQWTTQVLLTPCHGLMEYTGRFGCCSTSNYFIFSQWSPILCLPPKAFCQTRQRSPSSSLEALIFQSYCCFWQDNSLHWCWLGSSYNHCNFALRLTRNLLWEHSSDWGEVRPNLMSMGSHVLQPYIK